MVARCGKLFGSTDFHLGPRRPNKWSPRPSPYTGQGPIRQHQRAGQPAAGRTLSSSRGTRTRWTSAHQAPTVGRLGVIDYAPVDKFNDNSTSPSENTTPHPLDGPAGAERDAAESPTDQFRSAMTRVASAVSVVTCALGGQPHGATVPAFASPQLITTPRAVKRLANSYGLLAAVRRLTDRTESADEQRTAMVLLAALIGFPNLSAGLLTHLHRKAKQTPKMAWKTFLKDLEPTQSPVW